MSIHSSLRVGGKDKRHRSVLKRHERLSTLKDKNLWEETKGPYGLPKVKMQKLKVKKEAKVAAADATTGAVPAPGTAAPAAGKPAAAGGSASGGKPTGKEAGKSEKK